jgi:hypothetical protein
LTRLAWRLARGNANHKKANIANVAAREHARVTLRALRGTAEPATAARSLPEARPQPARGPRSASAGTCSRRRSPRWRASLRFALCDPSVPVRRTLRLAGRSPDLPGPVIRGRCGPPAGQAVPNHSVKHWLRCAWQAGLRFGRNCWNPASSCASVMLPPLWSRWICRSASVKFSWPRICRSAIYAASGLEYVDAPLNSPNGSGFDGAPTAGRCPPSTSAWPIHFRSVSGVEIPSFAATDRIAAYSVSYSPRCSATSRVAGMDRD